VLAVSSAVVYQLSEVSKGDSQYAIERFGDIDFVKNSLQIFRKTKNMIDINFHS